MLLLLSYFTLLLCALLCETPSFLLPDIYSYLSIQGQAHGIIVYMRPKCHCLGHLLSHFQG